MIGNSRAPGRFRPVVLAPSGEVARPRLGVAELLPFSSEDRYVHLRPPRRVVRNHPVLRAAFDAIPVPACKTNVRLLEGNRESWSAIWNVVTAQSGPVDSSYFIVERDIFGMAYLGALARRARGGDPVRSLVDAIGELGASGFARKRSGQEYLQELVRSGVDARVHHPIYKKILYAPGRLLRAILMGEPAFSLIGNNHQKLVRSGKLAVTGGRNISRDYFTPPEDRSDVFHDSDLMLEGEDSNQAAREAFERSFNEPQIQHRIRVDGFGDRHRREHELLGAFHLMDHWMKTPAGSEERDRLRQDPVFRGQAARSLVELALSRAAEDGVSGQASPEARERLLDLAWELCGYPGLRGASLDFSPDRESHQQVDVKLLDKTSAAHRDRTDHFAEALPGIVQAAQRTLRIRSAYLVLTHDIIEALRGAAARGVRIEILTNSAQSTDSSWTQADFLENWPGLLAAVPNLRLYVLTTARKLHCKDAVADEVLSLVSSYNLDITSERINAELGAMVWSGSLAAELKRSYDQDVSPAEHRVAEYTLARDASGQPLFREGRPVVEFGAKDHLPPAEWRRYQQIRRRIRLIRKIPMVSMLRHPALSRRPALEAPPS